MAMNFTHALDVLAGLAPNILSVNDATNLLQSTEAYPMIIETAFNPSDSSVRREVAFVLLRSRILTRQNANNADGLDGLITSALDNATDLNILRHLGSLISVLWRSVTKDQLDAHWQKSSDRVYSTLVAATNPQSTPDCMMRACTLISSIYDDCLPEHFNGLISTVDEIIRHSLGNENVSSCALKAVRAVSESYAGSANPPEALITIFHRVLSYSVHMIERGLWDRVSEVFKSIVNVCSDENTAWWNMVNLELLIQIMNACRYPILKTPEAPQIIENVIRISGSAFNISHVTKPIWEYYIENLAMEYTNDVAREIMDSWECKIETNGDDDMLVEGQDCCAVAYEQIDRIISESDSAVWIRLFKPTIDRLLTSERPQNIYAGWMILASCVEHNSTTNMFECMEIQPYLQFIKLEIPNDFYQARITHAVLSMLFDAFHAFGSACFGADAQEKAIGCLKSIIDFTQSVPIPRLKAKGLLLYYQFVSVVIIDKEKFVGILEHSLGTWLVRDLDNPWLLSSCSKSFSTGILDSKDPEVIGLELHIRELTISAVAGTISLLPHLDHQNFFNYAMNSLKSAPTDSKAASLAEACLDLASRCLEDPVNVQVFEANAPQLLSLILSFDELLKSSTKVRNQSKNGLSSQSFERTLLEAMARIANTASHDPSIVLNYIKNMLLGTVLNKLEISDVIKITDSPPLSTMTSAPFASPPENTATFVVKVAGPTSKTVNVNMSVIEDQIASLTFVGSITENCWNHLTAHEQFTIFSACNDITVTSPISFVRKTGIETLKTICEALEQHFDNLSQSIPGLRGDPKLPSPSPFLTHPQFVQAVTNYLKALKIILQTGADILKKSFNEVDEDDHIIYALADSCNGLKRIRNFFGCPLDTLLEVFPDVAEFPLDHLYSKLSKSLNTAMNSLNTKPEDPEDEAGGNEDVAGIRCDSVMQIISRLAKGLGNIVTVPFCTYLRSFYATILTTDEISIVARTAAICVFANHLDAVGPTPNVPTTELLLVALLYSRSLQIPPNKAAEMKRRLPQLSNGRPNLDEIAEIDDSDDEDLQVCAEESMKLQASCYCVGVALVWSDSVDTILNHIAHVDEAFAALLEHPAAAIPSRKSILDCLACAVVRTMAILPQSARETLAKLNLKVFSDQGFLGILEILFPLDDDHEDACVAHDVLIKYAYAGTLGALPPLCNEQENSPVSPKLVHAIKTQLERIITELKEHPDLKEIVSFSGLGRLLDANRTIF